MNNIKVTEVTSNQVVLENDFIRLGIDQERVSVMLKGGLNENARKLNTNKLYNIEIIENDVPVLNTYCNFISYNFIYINTETTTELAIGDNTLLFKALE